MLRRGVIGVNKIGYEVVNYPGIAKTSGKALTDTIQQQAESFGAEFQIAEATGFDLSGDIKTVRTNQGEHRCFGVLLATGAHPRTVGFKGEEEHKGRGVAYCATCDGEFFTGKENQNRKYCSRDCYFIARFHTPAEPNPVPDCPGSAGQTAA